MLDDDLTRLVFAVVAVSSFVRFLLLVVADCCYDCNAPVGVDMHAKLPEPLFVFRRIFITRLPATSGQGNYVTNLPSVNYCALFRGRVIKGKVV